MIRPPAVRVMVPRAQSRKWTSTTERMLGLARAGLAGGVLVVVVHVHTRMLVSFHPSRSVRRELSMEGEGSMLRKTYESEGLQCGRDILRAFGLNGHRVLW